MRETRSIYNTEPLLNEVELVIKNGLNKILAKTLQRYELLERTHKQLMKLPSIREEINNDKNNSDSDLDLDSDSDSDSDTDSDSDNKLNCLKKHAIVSSNKDDLLNVERKLDGLEKKYLNLYGLMDKLIDKIEVLNNKVDKMACEPKPIANISIKPSVESSIVSACKNENIKVDIDSDIEDLDDSSSKVTLTNLPIIVKKMEAEESAIEVIEAASEEEVVDTESVEEEEEEVVEEEVVEEEEEEVASEAEKEEEEEAASEAEKEEEADEDENSVETETKEEAEEEEELFEIDIDDITYCTNDEENGSIYELKDGDVGDKVGYFKEGEPFFYADEN